MNIHVTSFLDFHQPDLFQALYWIAIGRHSVPCTDCSYKRPVFDDKWHVTLPHLKLQDDGQTYNSFEAAIDVLNSSIKDGKLSATFQPGPLMSASVIKNAEESLKNLFVQHEHSPNDRMGVVLSTVCPIDCIRFNAGDLFSLWPKLDYEHKFKLIKDCKKREYLKSKFSLTDRELEEFDELLIEHKKFETNSNAGPSYSNSGPSYSSKEQAERHKQIISTINKLIELLNYPGFKQSEFVRLALWKNFINQVSPHYAYSKVEPFVASSSSAAIKKIEQAKPSERDVRKHIFLWEQLSKSSQAFDIVLPGILRDFACNLTDNSDAYPKGKSGPKEDKKRSALIDSLAFHCLFMSSIKLASSQNSLFAKFCEEAFILLDMETGGLDSAVRRRVREIKPFIAKMDEEQAIEEQRIEIDCD